MFAGMDCFTYLCPIIHTKQKKNMKLTKKEIIIEGLKKAMERAESESSIFVQRNFRSICATDLSPSGMEKFFDENEIPYSALCVQEDDGLCFDWIENTHPTEKQQNLLKVRSFKGYSYLIIQEMMFENGYKQDVNKEDTVLTCQGFYDMYVGGQYDKLVEHCGNRFV